MTQLFSCPNGHALSDQDQTCPVCGTIPTLGGIAAPPSPILPAIPGYDVVEEVGHGGMGVVYKARHQKLDRWVALKMIRNWSFAGREEQARFLTEAQAIAQLQHPHIVQIFEIGEWQGVPFLSLEFMEGGTLEKKLKAKPLAAREAASLLRQIAEAMSFAHQRGILHRDLKPANILLTLQGEPKVGDFGLAKRMDAPDGPTSPDAILGTPCYMAPEQAQRKQGPIGPPADIYALGTILYQMLTGRPPFWGENTLETIKQVLEQEPVPPRRLQPGVPRDLQTICLKCLRKDSQHRYASAADLAQDLVAFQEGKPIKARPVSRWEVAWSWCRRNPLPASLTALLLLVFLAAFGLVTWKWQEAEMEKAIADSALKKEELESQAKQEALDRLEKNSYVLTVQAAHQIWEEGNVAEAQNLLAGINPTLRHWEWDFLRNMHRSCEIALYRNYSPVRPTVAYSPDSKLIAFAGYRGYLGLRDPDTGDLKTSLKGHQSQVNCLAFSPDGFVLAAGDDNGTIILWDLTTFLPKVKLENLPGKITSVSISPDGNLLAFGWSEGFAVRSLDAPADQNQDLVWKCKRSTFANLGFSPDSSRLASSGFLTANVSRVGFIKIIDLKKPKASVELRGVHRNNCVLAAFGGPKGRYLISGGGGDGLINVWDADKIIQEWKKPDEQGREDRIWEDTDRFWLRTHEGNLVFTTSIALSPDNHLLASASLDNSIRVWDLGTGKAWGILRGHENAVTSLAFAPDKRRLVSASNDHTIRIWDLDLTEGAAVNYTNFKGFLYFALANSARRLFVGETLPRRIWSLDLTQADPLATKKEVPISLKEIRIQHLAVNAPGEWLAAAKRDLIYVWNAHTGKEKASFKVPADSIVQMIFHPTQPHLLATAQKDGSVHFWHVDDPAQHPEFKLSKEEARCLAFSPDGRWLAAGGKDKRIRIWDCTQPEKSVAEIHTGGPVSCLAFNPDGRDLAFWAGEDDLASYPIQIVEWKTGKPKAELKGHRQAVFSLAYHPQGNRLVSAGADNFLRAWDLATGVELASWHSHDKHTDKTRLAFSPDGRFAVSSGYDSVCVWDGTCHHERWVLRGHTRKTMCAAFSPEGTRLVSGADDDSLRAWDPWKGVEVNAGFPRPKAHKDTVNSVAFHPGGDLLASGSDDRTAILWDARTGAQRHLLSGHTDTVRWVAFSQDGKWLVTASNDNTCKLWNPHTGEEIRTLKGHQDKVNTAAFHPGNSLLASCSDDGTIRLWDPLTGTEKRSLKGHGISVTDVAFDRDGRRLASGDMNGCIFLWDAGTGKELARYKAYGQVLQGLAFHPKHANLLCSVGNDGLIKLWNLDTVLQNAEPGKLIPVTSLAEFKGHAGAVFGIAFRPDGRLLATTGLDRTVRVWDLDFLDDPAANSRVRRFPRPAVK